MKRWLFIGGIGVVVIIGVAVFVFSSLDSLVKAAVEKFGSEATGAKVTLNAVKISPTAGKGMIAGLTLGNPKGFKTGYAVKVGKADIVIDMATLTKSTVVIKEIRINSPDVIFEQGADGSNFDAIRKNVENYIGETGGGKSTGKSAAKKLIIENFIITNGTVNVSAAILGGRKVTASLPDIHLRNIGKKENGASPGAVAEKIIAAIGGGAGNAVAALGLGIGGIGKNIGQAAKAVTGVVAKGAAGIAGEGVKGAAGIVGEGVKGAAGIVEGGAKAIGGVLKGVFGGGGGSGGKKK